MVHREIGHKELVKLARVTNRLTSLHLWIARLEAALTQRMSCGSIPLPGYGHAGFLLLSPNADHEAERKIIEEKLTEFKKEKGILEEELLNFSLKYIAPNKDEE